MPHFKEALIFGAFVFLFYSVFEFLRKKNLFLREFRSRLLGQLRGYVRLHL